MDKFAGRVKGINGIKFYNNTFYSGDGTGWYLLLITANWIELFRHRQLVQKYLIIFFIPPHKYQ